MNDKEKLRHQLIMAKSLVKSNNKKIKKALDYINDVLDLEELDTERKYDKGVLGRLHTKIKSSTRKKIKLTWK